MSYELFWLPSTLQQHNSTIANTPFPKVGATTSNTASPPNMR